MVLKNPKYFGEVVDTTQADEPATRMRASDAVEKITRERPELLKPYKKHFLNEIAKIDQKEVRWHLAQILPRLNMTRNERKNIFNLMLLYPEDDSRIVKTFAMQALTDLAVQEKSYAGKVQKLVESLVKNGVPSMKSRGKRLLVILNKL